MIGGLWCSPIFANTGVERTVNLKGDAVFGRNSIVVGPLPSSRVLHSFSASLNFLFHWRDRICRFSSLSDSSSTAAPDWVVP